VGNVPRDRRSDSASPSSGLEMAAFRPAAEVRGGGMSERIYAGVGSRKTPADVLLLIHRVAERLGDTGWKLRTGHARGADKAFEFGAFKALGSAEIYLPWPGFEGPIAAPAGSDVVVQAAPTAAAYEVAAQHHPRWAQISAGAQALHARNSHQILGPDLTDPVSLVVCYSEIRAGELSGGTAQAVRIAANYNIDVINIADEQGRSLCEDLV
jgi:hypothetical protein